METAILHKEQKTSSRKNNSTFFKPCIQKKLSVGSANDSYEVEADQVADKVLKMSEPSPQVTHTGALVQRKCAHCEQEEKLRMKPLAEGISPLIQRSSSENGGVAPDHVESQINSSKGGGSVMDRETKTFMESRFGTDFSDVKIHTGSEAVQMSRELNAQAFAVGNDIYFNEGKYSPNSDSGKHLLAHELTHTVQQNGRIESKVQRHMQSTYPWEGFVSARWSAALRQQPSHTHFIADIPRGTRLYVIGHVGNWLNIRVFTGGIQMTGYMSQELVSLSSSDITTDVMTDLVGQQAAWTPSGGTGSVGNTSGNDFADWASAASERVAPTVKPSTTINCWEMVLLAAYRSGELTWSWIHDLYVNVPDSDWPVRMSSSKVVYNTGDTIPRGHLVFFNGTSHVALGTGSSDSVLTFWPPPDFSRYTIGTVDDVKIRSISSLVRFMNSAFGATTVEHGVPSW